MKTLLDKVPGTAWSGLLIAAAAIIQANFSEQALPYQVIMFLIFGALKGFGVNFAPVIKKVEEAAGEELDPAPVAMARGVPVSAEQQDSKITRWLLG